MIRTYRVQVTGQFDHPTPSLRAGLLAEQAQHELQASAFVPDGTFIYTPTLTRFTLRYLIDAEEASPAEADAAAELEGELKAVDYLEQRAIPFRSLVSTTTCLQDVKVRSQSRSRK